MIKGESYILQKATDQRKYDFTIRMCRELIVWKLGTQRNEVVYLAIDSKDYFLVLVHQRLCASI